MAEQNQSDFSSSLQTPIQRALSAWLTYAFAGTINTTAQLIEHFGITVLIKSLSPKVRGKVLCTCNGGGDPERAARQNADIVAMTIESMLKENPPLVTPDDICKEISTDHMVEVLPSQELYRMMFGKPVTNKDFMTKVLETLLKERLLGEKTASSYMHAIGDGKIIHERTPPSLLVMCQREMLQSNRGGAVFTDDDLLVIYTPSELVNYVDLGDLFAAVEAVAKENGWDKQPEKPGLPAGVVTPSEFPAPPPGASQPPPLSKKERRAAAKKRAEAAGSDDEPETTVEPGDGIELVLEEEEEADGPAQTPG